MSTLILQKGTFYENGGQKLNWFGLKCINQDQMYNKVPKTSCFQTENVKSLLWLQGIHNPKQNTKKHLFLANWFLFDLHIKKSSN